MSCRNRVFRLDPTADRLYQALPHHSKVWLLTVAVGTEHHCRSLFLKLCVPNCGF